MKDVIYHLIESIEPFDEVEKEHQDFALQWLKSGVPIFRTHPPHEPDPNLVCYFVIIDLSTQQMLLTDHIKSGLWLPGGGHIECSEDPKQTVIRELKEELGCTLEFLSETPFFLTVTQTVRDHSHTDVTLWYILKASHQVFDYDTKEFHQISWFPFDELPFQKSDPHLRRCVDKLLQWLTLQSYEGSAAEYADKTASLHPSEMGKKFMSLLPSKGRVLDVGCGPGRDAKIFSDKGFDVVGIDFSSQMIELAKKTAPKAKFVVMDLHKLDFPPNSFDGIWASACFLHISKRHLLAILSTLATLLVPGGILYFSVKQGIGEQLSQDSRYDNANKFWSFFEEVEWIDLLKQASFEIIEIEVDPSQNAYQTHPFIKGFCRKVQ